MKKVVLMFFSATLITVAMMSCSKDNGDAGKGEGTLSITGKSYSITESCMCVRTDGTVSKIVFSNENGSVVNVVTNNIELTSKTYTASEIIVVGFPLDGKGDFDDDFDDNVEMVVVKSGKTYDIIVTGKTKENEYEYTMTYKGSIRAENDLCNL